ncbi:MAG: selenide, water dikinase SelD, partial [Halioglobus sp.]|nr:selenide, water dikinase SelD [Halioglobus sp.]
MLPQPELRSDLVLVGGGHSHALVLRMLAMDPLPGVRVTLISPDSHTPYSGMLPGLIAGHYSFEDTHIDLARLCQWAGVRFIQAPVTALDPAARWLSLPDRPAIAYDIVSLDIGSQPELDSVPGAREHATPVKPVSGLWRRWQQLEARFAGGAGAAPVRIGVVGGGAGSVEIALAVAHRLGQRAQVALWCGSAHILEGYNGRARSAVMRALARRGITVHLGARVQEVGEGELQTVDARRGEFDELFWCTGASAAPWVADSGLATDARGFLSVDASLQSPDDPRVFGAGDIVTQLHDPRPKAGVYAVRQAPVLGHNLRAALTQRPLRPYRPQDRFLSLLSLGDRQAVADRGLFSASGAWVWRWKDRIDREFMTRFSRLPPMRAPAPTARTAEHGQEQPPCGGCGAKVSADALASALAALAVQFPEHCTGTGDDAAEIPAGGSAPVLQSVDVLRPLVADPYLMGRIAANHALSDLFASGARPVSALAAVTLPLAAPALLQRELQQLLAGALREFAAVDCVLNGGHSMQGPELQLGFTVNGVAARDDGRLLRKTGARVGDALLLT